MIDLGLLSEKSSPEAERSVLYAQEPCLTPGLRSQLNRFAFP
jgi:hypothetical protein